MKIYVAAFILSVLSCAVFSQSDQQINNQRAFAKLYGYVRYFYPGDEAQTIDWDKFAVYGTSQADKCKSKEELRSTLNNLFLPIAPSLKIFDSKENVPFNPAELASPGKSKTNTVAWQHSGIGFEGVSKNNVYASARTNRPLIKRTGADFGNIIMHLEDAKMYAGKEFSFTAKVKRIAGTGTGHLWFRVDKINGMGFFDNMGDRPITSNKWTSYSINGKIDDAVAAVYYGIFLVANGELLLDSIELKIKGDNGWETKFQSNLENDVIGQYPESIKKPNGAVKSPKAQPAYAFRTVKNTDTEDGKCISIKSVPFDDQSTLTKEKHELLFKKYAEVGEYIRKEIGQGLTCMMPLALNGDNEHTYPIADSLKLKALKSSISDIPDSTMTASNLYVRLADIAISWNIFQHFFMYFDIAKTNWADDLTIALTNAYHDKSAADFLITLQKLTAKLKDGHIRVSCESVTPKNYFLPLSWEWIENKLVVTNVFDGAGIIQRGDEITKINDIPALDYYKTIEEQISAATKGWMEFRANEMSLSGYKNSEVSLSVTNAAGVTSTIGLKRTVKLMEYYDNIQSAEKIKKIGDDIYYINIDGATDSSLQNLMPVLAKCKSIIFDLRGYPSIQPDLISHLLTQKDTSKKWMRVPQIIYPDEENITGYQDYGWELKPEKPHLDAKIIFIIDGSAISYAESFMSFIENYKLATIIGQPTAGTNGNVNPFTMPGGYYISFTGMKVLKHDGSQHHGVGIQPNIFLYKTIAGVRAGKDEFLEKAIELAKQ